MLGTCAELREVELSDTPLATAFDTKTFETLVRHHAGHVRKVERISIGPRKHVELDDDALEAAAQALEPVHESSKDSIRRRSPARVHLDGSTRTTWSSSCILKVTVNSQKLRIELLLERLWHICGGEEGRQVVTTSVCSTLDVARKLDEI